MPPKRLRDLYYHIAYARLDPDTMKEVDAFQKRKKLAYRAEAIRLMIEMALECDKGCKWEG